MKLKHRIYNKIDRFISWLYHRWSKEYVSYINKPKYEWGKSFKPANSPSVQAINALYCLNPKLKLSITNNDYYIYDNDKNFRDDGIVVFVKDLYNSLPDICKYEINRDKLIQDLPNWYYTFPETVFDQLIKEFTNV